MSGPLRVVLSCEHAGRDVPDAYGALFDSVEGRAALESHRGWDPGSLPLATAMAGVLDAPVVVQRVSRLVIECNRSLDHPRLFSEFSRVLPPAEKEEIIARYWRPHRDAVRDAVRGGTSERVMVSNATGPVLHVGVHTFTPVWKGRERATDIGFLFDPARPREADVVRRWRKALSILAPEAHAMRRSSGAPFRLHLNRPYRGWTDGLTTAFRREFPVDAYLGVELELSQRYVERAPEVGKILAEALQLALGTRLGTAS